MAVDITLKIEGVEGESRVQDHEDEIDVYSWSWGMINTSDMHSGMGGGSGKADIQDLSVTKYVDKATPKLARSCCSGNHFDEATLFVRKSGGDNPVDYLRIVMSPVIVTSVSSGGSGGDDRLMEDITLNFAKYELHYTPQLADGSADAEIDFTFNIEANREE